jgi:hypothetical protein
MLARMRLLVVSLLVVCGCTGGTETGNPVVSGSLSYTGYSSVPERFGVGRDGEVARVDSAWFNLAAVTVSAAGCGAKEREGFEIDALGLGDHAAGNHNSTAFETYAGSFCQLELPFAPVSSDAATAPEPLRGHALLLEGTLAAGTPFSILSDVEPRLPLQSEPGGFALSPGRADALVAFDFAVWLGHLSFETATVEDGVITISPAQNSDLLDQFENDLPAGVVLYRDRDADGVVDPEPEELARVR